MKKTLAWVLAVCLLCCCALPALAAGGMGAVRVQLNSDIAGLTENDTEQLIALLSGNTVYAARCVSFSDAAGTPFSGALEAGRTYTADYVLEAAPGYTLPERLSDGDVLIETGKGVSVFSVQIVSADYRDASGAFVPYRALRISAQVVPDGNIMQRIVGFLRDLILKIRVWSLY